MQTNIGLTILFSFLAIFLFILGGYAAYHSNMYHKEEHILSNWQTTLYAFLFRGKVVEKVADSLGINADAYARNCTILDRPVDLEKVIVWKVVSGAVLILGLMFGLGAQSYVLISIAGIVALALFIWPESHINSKAEEKRRKITNEMPRFLDLLYTALAIDMPVALAITKVSNYLQDTALGEALTQTMTDSELQKIDWTIALTKMAEEYNIDILSDFIAELSNAYKNGTPIADFVKEKSKDIRATTLILQKEQAGRLTNTILIPIFALKILPIIILVGIPIVIELNNFGFF